MPVYLAFRGPIDTVDPIDLIDPIDPIRVYGGHNLGLPSDIGVLCFFFRKFRELSAITFWPDLCDFTNERIAPESC